MFYFAITKFDLKTPGREDEDAEEAEKKVVLANNNYTEVAAGVLKAIGGKENVSSVDYCATRLRFTIKDYTAGGREGCEGCRCCRRHPPRQEHLPGGHRHQGAVRVRRAEEDAVTHPSEHVIRAEGWLLPHPFPNCKNAAEGGRLRPAFGGILFCSQIRLPFVDTENMLY